MNAESDNDEALDAVLRSMDGQELHNLIVQAAAEAMEESGQRAGETPEERRKRKNRENIARWRRENREEYRAIHLERMAKWRRDNPEEAKKLAYEYRLRLKLDVIGHYSHGDFKCALCTEARLGALTIDHINGDGSRHRKEIGRGYATMIWLRKNQVPTGFRVLCMNHNWKAYIASRPTPSLTRTAINSRRHNLALKLRFMDRLGGKCVVCGEHDLDLLTHHHVENNGAGHRRAISKGKGGASFYRAILKLGDFVGLECRCFSCNCEEEWRCEAAQ